MSGLSTAQQNALNELWAIDKVLPEINLVQQDNSVNPNKVTLELDLSRCERRPGGLPVHTREQVIVSIGDNYPIIPPLAWVPHHRWVGFPHILMGNTLCIYLDVASEWDPEGGMRGFLYRLWDWFSDAIANKFDAATALYHPVGGILHRTPGTPTVVAARSLTSNGSNGFASRITLLPRTPHRVDIAAWDTQPGDDLMGGVLVTLAKPIPMGGGSHLADLLNTVHNQGGRTIKRKLVMRLRRVINSLSSDQYLYVVVAVPNPVRHQGTTHHLIGWRLSQQTATRVLEATRSTSNRPSSDQQPEVEWTYIDDQRPEAHVRRDINRPISFYANKTVAVWGCGAIGSWVGELLVRAGARKVILRDPGYVTQGLLVRQNYREDDVGRNKAEALAEHLGRLSDQVDVLAFGTSAELGFREDAAESNLIFDTSINASLDAYISKAQQNGTLRIPVVQVATDNQSATLGIVTVTNGKPAPTTRELDQQLHQKAQRDPALQPFYTFWDPNDTPPLVPTPGCSIPTFNGSCADAMSIAASAVSLAAIPLDRRSAGGYLFATPYSQHQVPPRTEMHSNRREDL